MKKRIAALATACVVAALCGCATGKSAAPISSGSHAGTPNEPNALSGQITPASLTDEEAEIATLLAPGVQYQIFEFELAEPVKTVRFNRYRLENGTWTPEGGSAQTLNATRGRIALVSDNSAKKNRLTLQSEGGGSAISYDLPEGIGEAGITSAAAYLSEAEKIVYDKEIPLQIQIFTAQSSLSSYDVSTFDQPALYAQHGYEHVYAITVIFSQQALG